MKTFNITTFPIVAGIAVPITYDLRCKTEQLAIRQTSKKHLSFCISESYFDDNGNMVQSTVKHYRNYDGVLELV